MENKFVVRLAEDIYIGTEIYKNIFSSLIFELEDNCSAPKLDPAGNLIFNNEYMSFDKYPNEKQKIFEAANNLYRALNKKYDVVDRKIVLDIYYLYEKFRELLEQHYQTVLKENGNDLAKLNYSGPEEINTQLDLEGQKKKSEYWSSIRKRWYYILSWFFIFPGLAIEIFRYVRLKKLSEQNKIKNKDTEKIKSVNTKVEIIEKVKLYDLAINRQLAFLQANEIHLKILAEKINDPGVAEKFKNMSVNEILLSGDKSIAVAFVSDSTKNMEIEKSGAVSQTYRIKQDKLILQYGKLIYNGCEIGNLIIQDNHIVLKSDKKNVILKELDKNYDMPGTMKIYLENKLIGELIPNKVACENNKSVFEYKLKSSDYEVLYLKQGALFFDINHMKMIVEKELTKKGKSLKEDFVILKNLLSHLLANKFNDNGMTNGWREKFENPYGFLPGSYNRISAEIWQELFRGNTNIDYVRKVIDYLTELVNAAKGTDGISKKDILIDCLDTQAINTAYDGYIMYAIAKRLGVSCIAKTDIVVTEKGYANIMANAVVNKNLDYSIFSSEQQESALWLNILDYICYNRDRGGWNFEVNKNGLIGFDNDWSVPARTFLSKNYKMPSDYLNKILPLVTKDMKEKIIDLKTSDIKVEMKMFCGTKDLLLDRFNGVLERLNSLKEYVTKEVKCYDELNKETGRILFEKSKNAGCLGQGNGDLKKIRYNAYDKNNDHEK